MKKLYLLFYLILITLFGYGQSYDSASEEGRKISQAESLKSSSIQSIPDAFIEESMVMLDTVAIFNYTGSVQYFTVPAGVFQVKIEAYGAQGGASEVCGSTIDDDGGLGGYAEGTIEVNPGDILQIFVGGKPLNPTIGQSAISGGFNGGGDAGQYGGAGGGASDVRIGTGTINERVIVAGGGGGGNTGCPNHGTGGAGGGLLGNDGIGLSSYSPGGGGTQVTGGAGAYSGPSGTFGFGGSTTSYHFAGGGGGWYGGGTAYAAGAGGGSSYIEGLSDAQTIAGVQTGNGLVQLSWISTCVGDIVQDNDPGECGAVVTYDQPSAWDTATVTQIDESGLTSGDYFPVDTTVQSYRVDYGDGHIDTCTFTVIVEDVEDPVALCKDITLVLDSTGHASLSAGDIYFAGTFGNSVWKYDGNSVTELYNPAASGTYGPVGVRFVKENGMLYFTGGNYSEVYSANADGSGTPAVLPNSQFGTEHHDLAIDYANGRYFFGASGVHVANLDGSGTATDLSTSFDCDEVPGIEYDPVGKKLYFSNLEHECISSLNDDGTDYTVLFDASDGVARPRDVAIDVANSLIYWTNLATGTIMSGNLDGTGTPVVLYTALPLGSGSGTFGLYLSGSTLYWTTFNGRNDPYDDRIYKASADGSGTPELVVQGSFGGIRGLFVDGTSINNGSSDNCGLLSLEASKTEFTSSDIGDNLVSLTVTDVHGNVSTCNSTVTVVLDEDVTPPVALCANLYIYDIEALGGTLTIKPDVIDNGSYDNVEIVSYSLSQSDFTCADVGENIITLTVADSTGNEGTCKAVVNINDPNAPVFEALSDITVELERGDCETSVDYPEIVATDGCEVTLTLLEGLGADGSFPVGTTVEKWEAKDLAGNADTLTFSVVVTTQTVPVIDAIEDVTVDIDVELVEVALTGIADLSCLIDGLSVTASTEDDTIINSLNVDYENLAATGMLTVVLETGVTGSATITLTLENSVGGVTEESFVITVMDVNDVPSLLYPVEDQTVNAARVLKIPLSSVSGEYFTDSEDQVLTLTVFEEGSNALPVWATMSGDTLVCEPVLVDSGCINIVVEAADTEGATATDTFTICVEGYVLGLGDLNAEGIELNMYPNPSKGNVTIDLGSMQSKVEIAVLDLNGRTVMNKEFQSAKNIQIDLSGQVSGTYLIRIQQDSEIQIRKLVLNKN